MILETHLNHIHISEVLFRESRDCSGDGVTSDGGYGDITGDKIITGEVTG